MSELNGVRMANFVKRNTQTSKAIRDAISVLTAHLPDAIKQEAYAHKNPDNITDMPAYIAGMSVESAELIDQFRDVVTMVDAYEAGKGSVPAVDSNITTYNVNLPSMSLELIKG